MSRQVFLYDQPERFVAGTVGLPGRRTFFLQASAGSRVTSVALEKTQVAALQPRRLRVEAMPQFTAALSYRR